MKKTILASLLMCASLFAAQDPVALLKQNDVELQKELRKKTHTAKDIERIKFLSSGLFDFPKMAERSLPRRTLDTITPAQKAEFAKEFQRMIENNSVHKFKNSNFTPPDSTVYKEPRFRRNGEEVEVSIHSWSKGKDMLMVYKMDKSGNSWRVWDLIIDDLSTTRNYQDQFKSILETKSFQELIKTVKDKADEYDK
ncbi:MAG: ABC transporter substrate-binding protein [Fibromonadaceae bacterium]|jgi:phospholipid transport system substrate-binding protein|nr:ABC transporter substrate-binding protein [Fibromonadaceae bacterium]